ncbi:MAG TPA: 3',5'-cyclic-nucleotide phosphodiesterase, partial [Methylotenera sp.]|nr:3',5'-cyclic-nucleotide phosphodiesterase [Methylotenera sp.]
LVNKLHNLKYLIIETAFRNDELELAKLSKHLCPSLLVDELNKITLTQQIEVFITHLKPGEGGVIMQEIAQSQILRPVQELKNQQQFIV